MTSESAWADALNRVCQERDTLKAQLKECQRQSASNAGQAYVALRRLKSADEMAAVLTSITATYPEQIKAKTVVWAQEALQKWKEGIF